MKKLQTNTLVKRGTKKDKFSISINGNITKHELELIKLEVDRRLNNLN